MPLPPYVVFAALIPCETVLFEQDGTASAIRIIDAVYLPRLESASGRVNILFAAKFEAGHNPVGRRFRVEITNPLDETTMLLTPEQVSLKVAKNVIDPSAPFAANVALQLTLLGKDTGVYKIRGYIDDNEVAEAAITLLLEPEQQAR